ncbi:MAG TPA: DEAD/DEAH box helicase, partial [Methanothrix sp.]|nr:DEAD/DEAH box helicase [Methanothrix sp.]
MRQWWLEAFGSNDCLFTPPQRQAVPLIRQGKNVLICSPTGSGKTLSAFISIINQLFVMAAEEKLDNSVYCLYISPLKSLANDIHRNLSRPLSEIQALAKERGLFVQDIRHAIRHGDIPAQEKARMNRSTPHILNTTPESFAILLSSPRFREKLATVKWVIVDEIHSLAASKRGVHLTLSLERLEELKREFQGKIEPQGKDEPQGKNKTAGKDGLLQTNGGKGQGEIEMQSNPEDGGFVRIGCSATVEPLREVADFLAGNFRAVEIVDCRFSRSFDLRLSCPVPDLIGTDQKELSDRFYELLHRLVAEHRSALIFANSRNGAERVLNNMRERYPQSYDAANSACHHGSMGRDARLDTESRLKQGQLKMVCTSTSLELGIDMPHIDLVIQIGSPKSVASLLQRFGRGGHSLDQVVVGRIIALKEDDILECAVMLEKARRGEVERIHIAKNALDALCQHILGMSLERGWLFEELLHVVRRSYCYRSLDEGELMSAVLYLSAALPGMKDRSIYPRIRYDPATRMISGLGAGSRMIYNTNSGMIADQFSCDLFTKDGRWVGRLDESYLERLEPKDVFSVGGQSYSFCFRRGGKIYVEAASEKPGIPTWSSERLPLSFDLGRSVLSFQGDLLWMMKSQ